MKWYEAVVAILAIVGVFALCIAIFVFAFMGVQHHTGTLWAIVLFIVSCFIGQRLYVIIGCFLFAYSVMQWGLALSIIFALPLLAVFAFILVGGSLYGTFMYARKRITGN